MRQILRLAVVPLALVAARALSAAPASAQVLAKGPASSSPGSISTMLAQSGYAAIPFTWRDGADLYQFVDGKVDTATVDFALDSGMNFDFTLDPSLDALAAVRPVVAATTTASAYGSETSRNATLDRIMLGPVALGPLTGRLAPPIISSAKGMLGVTVFTAHAAIFDFATDTLYLLKSETVAPLAAGSAAGAKPAGTVRAVLESAGQYHTFLSLMQTAGLSPLLEQVAGAGATSDSLVWMGVTLQAIHHAGLDTLADGADRLRLARQAMNQQFRPAGHVTVFAPTDSAFARLAPVTMQALQGDTARLAALLRAHMLTGTYLEAGTLRTLVHGASQPAGATLGFHVLGSRLDVDRLVSRENGSVLGRATIVQPDLVATDGVAHGIDRVLFASTEPPPVAAALARDGYVAVPLIRLPMGGYAVQAQVNGKPLLLLVDTGAPVEVSLDGQVADHLNLQDGESVSLVLGAGPAFQAGVESLDLSRVNARAKLSNSPSIDGLLGTHILTKYRARYDLGAGVLYLHY